GHRVIWQGSGSESTRHTVGTWVIRYRIVWLDSGGIGSPGMTAGTGSTQASGHFWLASGTAFIWQGSVHRVHQALIVWLDSGHSVTRYDSGHWVNPGIRSFGLPAGTASSGKAVGTGVTSRHWIVWLDSGPSGSPGNDSGHCGSPGIRSFGSPAWHRVIWQG
ncbi:unnamed protein product, partial [Staurois parvus]